MLRTLLRRTAIGVLGFAAVLFSVFGTQSTEVAAQDLFTRVGCTYGDYACYYSRTGVATQSFATQSFATQGYPTTYAPFGYNTYTPAFFNNTYTPAFFNYNTSFVPAYSRFGFYNGYYYGYAYGSVPDRFFTAVGCNVGNYTCLRSKV